MNRQVRVVAAPVLLCAEVAPFRRLPPRKRLISAKSTNSSPWRPAPCTLARRQKPSSMTASDTSSYSRSGMPTPRPRFIGDRRTETFLAPLSYLEGAYRRFKPPEKLDLRPSASQTTVSNTDTCCLVLENKIEMAEHCHSAIALPANKIEHGEALVVSGAELGKRRLLHINWAPRDRKSTEARRFQRRSLLPTKDT